MNRWKQIAVVLTVVASVLSGCGFLAKERPPQQVTNESAPGVVQSSPRADLNCCQDEPSGTSYSGCVSAGNEFDMTIAINGDEYKITGSGRVWIHSTARKYCVEEGSSISFSNGEIVEGPKRGKY